MTTSRTAPHDPRLAFLYGGGEMGARMRAFDWSTTPLGDPAGWPQALKTLVGLMLASEQPMFMAWGAGQVWLYNSAFIPIMGAKHPQRLGRHALNEVWNEAYAVLEPLFARVFAGEPVHMDDFALELDRRGRLEEAHFAFSYTPVRDESGGVAGLFGACIETTERVLAERRIAADQERQRRLFEQAPSFMCIMRGPEHVFEFVNNAHKLLFNSAGWLGKPAREAFPVLASQGYIELLDKVYASGRRHIGASAPVRYAREPGGAEVERLLDFIYEPMLDDAGRVTGIFCEGFDVTEARRAEQTLRESEAELREADRRKDEFLATLAHELRNPLAPIANALEVLNLQGSTQDVPRAARALIDRQLKLMVRLIDDLLDASRIASGKLELRRAPVELAAVIEQAVETSRPLVHGLEFSVSLPPEPVWVDADAVRLAQVFSALINNACKYTPPGGRVRLEAARAGRSATVRVKDSGIGIPAEHMPQLFAMFSQASSARAHAHGGLGIGLALSRALVELHGGTIEAASEGLGRGAEFTVTLAVLDAGAAPRAGGQGARSAGSPRRILVADDNPDAAASLALLLRAQGHTVQVVNDGAHAVQAAGGFMPDVILLDIGLPGMSGYDVCRAIRSRPSGKDVVIAAITGWGQETDRRKARDAGFDAHLVKPVDSDALFALVSANSVQRT